MANVRVQLKLRGLNALMTSREATAAVVRSAKKIQAAAGEDFEVDVVPHRWTARAYVRAKNARGMREEARNKVLTRALNAAKES
ncbi:hypothetical protein LVJ59_17505 [Microbacterium sp. KKR3/1]|uniref:hypothetical protein n=1 Tax=Microbacterium sp. KKR3/1 TaxID=2904241 RepID=UPI001E6259A0|nr:hypothetical protein [Microbacterium sp. KKR3/1]MCE0510848.1 hypothetical protein [Microbacterium sp. KKR3/1]